MADSHLSPCKVSYNGAFRRFLIARPALWLDFEDKIRTVYDLPANVTLDVQYKDDEGDVITLNTDSELHDVLSMHSLFGQVAPVKFEVSVREQQGQPQELLQEQPLAQSVASVATSASTLSPVLDQGPPQLTSWRLNDHNQVFINQRADLSSTITSDSINGHLNQPRQHSNSLYESEHSDDVSLIDLEDGTESRLDDDEVDDIDDQTITYPQSDLVEAAQLQEKLEAYKLDAPVFRSSLLGGLEHSTSSHEVDHVMETTSPRDTTATEGHAMASDYPKVSDIPSAPFAEFESMLLRGISPAISESIVASAVEQQASPSSEEYKDAQEKVTAADEDPAEQILPSTSTASTSTSERHSDTDEQALIEQFQQLIKEFQDIIQNNPQLVALAGGILNKILNNVKVNVESFASSLQAQAQMAAQNAQEVAAQAATQAQAAASQAASHVQGAAAQAATHVQEAAANVQEAASKAQSNPFAANSRYHYHAHQQHPSFGFGHRHGFQGHSHHNHTFSNFYGPSGSSMTPVPPVPHRHPFAMPPMPPMPSFTLPPMPPMPAMPPTPPMPYMPSMPSMPHYMPFGSSPETSSSATLGRSNTVHSSKPSPFSRGFPFNTTPPTVNRSFTFKSDRPVPGDTEANQGHSNSGSMRSGKGKAKATVNDTATVNETRDQGPSSSASPSPASVMPGSFPSQQQMEEARPGWTWTHLPDEGSEHHQPPSTRAKYGWVWNDIGGEKTEVEEAREPAPLYTPLEETVTTPGSFPGRPGFGPFRGRGSIRGFGHSFINQGTDSNNESSVSAAEKLRRRQTYHESNKQREQTETPGVKIEQGQVRSDVQKVVEEHQNLIGRMRLAQQRVDQIANRVRPASHYGSFTSGTPSSSTPSDPSGAGSLAYILSGTNNNMPVTTATTPGDFPRAPIVAPATLRAAPVPVLARAPAPIPPCAPVVPVASVASVVPVASVVSVVPVAPVASVVPVAPVASVVPVAPVASVTPLAPATPATPVAPVAPAVPDINPFADPYEFEEEIQTLMSMGFQDNEELRAAVHDCGGEVEAVIELLFSL